jgi:hypothetical protein
MRPDLGLFLGRSGTFFDNGYFINNTLDDLWPTVADSGPVLLIWDNPAWADSWRAALGIRGIPLSQITGTAVTAADFDVGTYRMIVITEMMFDASMPNMHNLVADMEDYVLSGGVLVDMVATNFQRRWSLGVPGPFGTVTEVAFGFNSYVELPGHPMVAGMSLPFNTGNSDYHARLVGPPAGSQVLLTEGTTPGGTATAAILSINALDCNGNGVLDACEPSADNDGIPDECDPCPNRRPGDVDGDGFTDNGDVLSFVSVLLDPGAASADDLCAADTNEDTFVDGMDASSFIGLILSQ